MSFLSRLLSAEGSFILSLLLFCITATTLVVGLGENLSQHQVSKLSTLENKNELNKHVLNFVTPSFFPREVNLSLFTVREQDHLQDVKNLFFIMGILAKLSFIGMFWSGSLLTKKQRKHTTTLAGIFLIVFIVLFAAGYSSFANAFNLLHSFFFAEGSWLFPYDSLLIQLYPIEYFMHVGIYLLVVLGIEAMILIGYRE